jgi:putative colanic acid biosynthesis acetyltransferase WcaF
VDIANNVCLSQGAMLLCGNHDYKKVTFDLMVKPIILEEGAWVGAQSVVCPGIKVGKYALLSVASVATDDLEAEMIYRGVPAEKVKARF